MSKVTSDMSMSLDGFITGPNGSVDVDRLHEWMYDLEGFRRPHGMSGGEKNRDSEILDESFKAAGAYVMGRRMFDVAEEPWGDNPPFHGPVFVVTHNARETLVKEGGTTFTFVTDGIESAVKQAKTAAGDKNVAVPGGANLIQQLIKAGLLDEIQIHIAPVLLGDGRRLFEEMGPEHIEMKATRVIDSPTVTHIRFQIIK